MMPASKNSGTSKISPMKKPDSFFSCSHCGAQFTKWVGRCLECGKWGTIQEDSEPEVVPKKNTASPTAKPIETTTLKNIVSSGATHRSTNIPEVDRVLGGGIVRGSFILLGGEPGVGKSTLALQLAGNIQNTLYVSGEESLEQIKIRANRLGIKSETLELGNETDIDRVIATAKKKQPALLVVDSIQTIYSGEVESEPGSVLQIRASGAKLMDFAKSSGVPVVIIGQVTKDGNMAGPKMLEHIVDTVLYLEGDRRGLYRLLRATKHRFGSTDEVGVFTMEIGGLTEVKNPSAAFLAERDAHAPPGSVVTCLMEGTRPLLVEIQALVTKTAFGYPVRKANGFDLNRLHLLIAVLQKRVGLNLEQYDVHVNVVGGITADEPAADLAVALAIGSAYKDHELGADLVAFGEIGLSGEIRPVPQLEKRLKEATQLGFKRAATRLPQSFTKSPKEITILNQKNIASFLRAD